MDYAVNFNGKQVGQVKLTRQGLYYHLICQCAVSGDTMYRLEASGGTRKTDLGILVPMGQGFGMETRFPVSRLGEGELSFCLHGDALEKRICIPIKPEEPFAYISRLKDAFLVIQDGQKLVSIPAREGET